MNLAVFDDDVHPKPGEFPLVNFETELMVHRPKAPDEVDWVGQWHLKTIYETFYHLVRDQGYVRIKSVRTFALLTRSCPSQGWRHIEALQEMGLIEVERGRCGRYPSDAESSIITLATFARVDHFAGASASGTYESPGSDQDDADSGEVIHIRELDPWSSDNDLWAPSSLSSHGREVAQAGLAHGPGSINAYAKRAHVAWNTAKVALFKMRDLGIARCEDGIWTINEEAITRSVATPTYDRAMVVAQDLHHRGCSEGAREITRLLGFCRPVGRDQDSPRRVRYLVMIRAQRAQYKEGPSCKWIRRSKASSGPSWGRVHYRVT